MFHPGHPLTEGAVPWPDGDTAVNASVAMATSTAVFHSPLAAAAIQYPHHHPGFDLPNAAGGVGYDPSRDLGKNGATNPTPWAAPPHLHPPEAKVGMGTTEAVTTGGGIHRRPRTGDAFHEPLPLGKVPTESTSVTASVRTGCDDGATLPSSSGGADEPWRVRLNGDTLRSTSYGSLHDDPHSHPAHHAHPHAHHATRMLHRLSLNRSIEEKGSSTATTKASNYTFQTKIQTKPALQKALSLSASAYYRPVDTLEKRDGSCTSPPPPPPTKRSVRSAEGDVGVSHSPVRSPLVRSPGVRSPLVRSPGIRSMGVCSPGMPHRSASEPSELSVAIDTVPSGVSSLSYNSSEDGTTPHSSRRPPTMSSHRTPPSCRRPPSNRSGQRGPSPRLLQRSPHLRRQSPHCPSLAVVKSASGGGDSDDDSELKRMESVTHTFHQKNDALAASGGRRESRKFSAVPMSNVGVDVRNDYDGDRRVRTPRGAIGAGCSLASFMGEMLGVTPPREGEENGGTPTKRSPFNIVKSILCSPDRVHDAGVSVERNHKNGRDDERRPMSRSIEDDNWSVGVDSGVDVVRRRSGSFAPIDDAVHSRYSIDCHSHAGSRRSMDTPFCRGSTPFVSSDRRERSLSRGTREMRQERYDNNVTYRNYHKEDLSYYGTEAGTSVYQPSCIDDDRSDAVSRSSEPFRRGGTPYRYSGRGRRSMADDGQSEATSRMLEPFRREGTPHWHHSDYSKANDDRSDTASRLSEPFDRRVYRDSPFVARRLKSHRFEGRQEWDDDSSYA